MSIVQHCTPFSYSLLPAHPLLSAPPVYPALAAPKVSGLLAAPKPTIIVEKYTERDLFLEALDPLGCIEDMDYRLDQLYANGNERRRLLREKLEARLVEKRRQRQAVQQ